MLRQYGHTIIVGGIVVGGESEATVLAGGIKYFGGLACAVRSGTVDC